ncbi:hypothetical protein AVEN_79648-1 [Araneus ventricosus]|uniref:Uncharacterized protein n=1 Tax=Araneus ventricosus TaxID=182803 RepID=A0A4Y2K4B9_ARAVE|nr:hypothetical protein AVEN_79648-1 [Araneus ventricosus]
MDQHTTARRLTAFLAPAIELLRRLRSKAIPVDQHTPSSKRSPYIVFPAGRDVSWNDLAHSRRIFSPNRDIEKIPAPLRSHISSPKSPNLSPSRRGGRQVCRQSQGSRLDYCPSSDTYPYKTLFLTIRLTLLGCDLPCL